MARAGSSQEPSSRYRTRDVVAGVRGIAGAAGGYAPAARWCDFGNIPIRLSIGVVILGALVVSGRLDLLVLMKVQVGVPLGILMQGQGRRER